MVQTRSVKTGEKRGPGRPAMYTTDEERKAAAAEAAREYRARVRREKRMRRNPNLALRSKVIDLSTDLSAAILQRV